MDKVTEACHRIEELWNETNGKCYVSFSGGKDSTVVLALIKLCQELYTVGDIPAVFSNTGVEMGVTVEFVKWCKANWYKNIVMITPAHSFDYCLHKYGKPVRSKLKSEELHRWHAGTRTDYLKTSLLDAKLGNGHTNFRCKISDKDLHFISDKFDILPSPMCCTVLKKRPMRQYEKQNGMLGTYVGNRQGEGGVRALRVQGRLNEGAKPCTWSAHGVIYKAPLIDWQESDVDEFIEKYNVPLSKAYTDYGFTRTGCMGCPFAQDIGNNLRYLHDHEPNRYKASMYWLKDVYIAQNVVLPFDESYERERQRMAGKVRTNAPGNAEKVSTWFKAYQGWSTVEHV